MNHPAIFIPKRSDKFWYYKYPLLNGGEEADQKTPQNRGRSLFVGIHGGIILRKHMPVYTVQIYPL